MESPAELISTYILAKDGSRPWLMRLAFAADARLEVEARTSAISFPSTVIGADAITETLVRRFTHDNENVYTFCLTPPPEGKVRRFACDWLVGMSRRANCEVLVGCGRYDWSFAEADGLRVTGLSITIEMMQVLAADRLLPVMKWLAGLPYPWCPAGAAVEGVPDMEELKPVREFLGGHL